MLDILKRIHCLNNPVIYKNYQLDITGRTIYLSVWLKIDVVF